MPRSRGLLSATQAQFTIQRHPTAGTPRGRKRYDHNLLRNAGHEFLHPRDHSVEVSEAE